MAVFNKSLYLYPPEKLAFFVQSNVAGASVADIESVPLRKMGVEITLEEIYGSEYGNIELTVLADEKSLTSRLALLGATPLDSFKYGLRANRQFVLRAFNRSTSTVDLRLAYTAFVNGENTLGELLYKATKTYYGTFTEKTILVELLGGEKEIAVTELRYKIINLAGGGRLVIERDGVEQQLDLAKIPSQLQASVLMRARQIFRIYVIPADPANPPELSAGVVYQMHRL